MLEIGKFARIAGSVAASQSLAASMLRSKPNLDEEFPERIRFPKAMLYLSWVGIAIGMIFPVMHVSRLFSKGIHWTDFLLFPFLSAFAIAGIVCLVVYRNWYLSIKDDAIHWRTRLLGRTYALPFSDIKGYKIWHQPTMDTVKVWGKGGQRVGFPISYFPTGELMQFLEKHPELRLN